MSAGASLSRRLLLALAAAAVALVALSYAVEALDRGPAPTRRAQASLPAGGGPGGSGAARPPFVFEPVEPTYRAALGFEPQALHGVLAVGPRTGALPSDVAPVVEVLQDGSVAVRRPPPLAAGPASPQVASRDGYGAGVVLPSGGLDRLSPAARAAFCGLLGRWFPGRPVPSSRLRSLGFRMPPADLERLLRWVP